MLGDPQTTIAPSQQDKMPAAALSHRSSEYTQTHKMLMNNFCRDLPRFLFRTDNC